MKKELTSDVYRNEVLKIVSEGSTLQAVRFLKDNHCHGRTVQELLSEVNEIVASEPSLERLIRSADITLPALIEQLIEVSKTESGLEQIIKHLEAAHGLLHDVAAERENKKGKNKLCQII